MDTISTTSDLFEPVRMGPLTLANRVVMAPLTRSRAGAGDAPGPMNATYYGQRASAGLIISEATQISQQGKGYAWTPGMYTEEQVAGWRLVTEAVHAKGGHIFAQLWHVGRISHPDIQPGHALPVGPSAIQPKGQAFTESGFKPFVTPRALDAAELPGIVADYRHAAECALRAGFDGVEIHAANGYLLDQFLRDGTNRRTDAYGGSVENRARLTFEVVEAITQVVEPGRVGIRLSPASPANDTADSDPMTTFSHVVDGLNRFGLAYLHCVEGATGGARDNLAFDFAALRRRFDGLYMANNGYDATLAFEMRRIGQADLIAFGRPFISNPDLVERLRAGAELAVPDKSTFYGGGEKGYTDYPPLS